MSNPDLFSSWTFILTWLLEQINSFCCFWYFALGVFFSPFFQWHPTFSKHFVCVWTHTRAHFLRVRHCASHWRQRWTTQPLCERAQIQPARIFRRHALRDYGSMRGGGEKRNTEGSIGSGTRPRSSKKKRGHREQNVGNRAGESPVQAGGSKSWDWKDRRHIMAYKPQDWDFILRCYHKPFFFLNKG